MTARDRLLVGVPIVIAGFLLGAWQGAAVAFAAAIVAVWAPQLVAPYAFGAVLLTGVLSVTEHRSPTVRGLASFVADRPLASNLGMVAGVLVTISLVERAVAERSRSPHADPDRRPQPLGWGAVLSFAAGATVTAIVVAPAWSAIAGAAMGAVCIAVVVARIGISRGLRRGTRGDGQRAPAGP